MIINSNLSANPLIVGYRIKVSGRFTRTQRASKLLINKGNLSCNKYSNEISYYFGLLSTRYGISGVKIWLSTNRSSKVTNH
jgi:ribosomal protein S3